MPGFLWWVQFIGGTLSALVSFLVIVGGAYAFFRGMPEQMRDILGVTGIDEKLDHVLSGLRATQQIQLAEADAVNELNDTVCEMHDIPENDRPPVMDVDAMREEMGKDETLPDDFTRNPND